MALFKLDDVFTYQDANDIKTLWPSTPELEAAVIPANDYTDGEIGEVRLDLLSSPIRLKRRNSNGWEVIGEITAQELLAKLLTVSGSGSGLDADKLDGTEGSSFVRNDQDNTVTGTLSCPKSGSVIVFDNGDSRITVHDGDGNLNIKSGVDEDYQIIGTDGGSHIRIMENGEISLLASDSTTGSTFAVTNSLKVTQTGVTINGDTAWHAGNDGSGSGLDADKLDGQEGSFYRNASNLNAGTVPAERLALWRNNDDDETTGLFIQCGLREQYGPYKVPKAFSEAYTSSVVVVATAEDSGKFCSVTSVTTTGFTIKHPTDVDFARWIAIGKKT
jgi:hypothetical protein